ncbi:MAG: hypothetical protein IJQ57_05935 [Synergistaceae bacterium]|nr:hypothetical protein [Synergistaceae bacterium]MBR0252872.1 hypothetical protein [Synergistaceae bacterium]
MWTVIAGKNIRRRLERIPNPDRERIIKAVCNLENNHELLDIKPMVGLPYHRLRVGKWRLIMQMNDDEKTIFIRALDTRGDVYKK